jgi:hypothetical protein
MDEAVAPAAPVAIAPVRKSHVAGVHPLLLELLELCRDMVPLVQQGFGDTEAGFRLVSDAERVIARTEREIQRQLAVPTRQKSSFFGRVGNHYDFEVTVYKVLQRQHFCRIEGRDRIGRRMVVRVATDEEVLVSPGETVMFRGRVKAHRAIFGEPVTCIETTSGVMRV